MDIKVGLYTDSVHFCHRASNTKNTEYILHCHNFFEVFYFIQGNISYLVEGKQYTPTPHSILIMSPNVFHGVKTNSDAIYERFALHFLPNVFSLENRVLLLSPFSKPSCKGDIYYENVNAFKMKCYFENLLDCRDMSSDIKEVATKFRVEALLSQILFMSRTKKGSSCEVVTLPVINNIITYLNDHLTETITLDNISNKFFISKHHLNKVFRKAIGTTVGDYIIHKRVVLAYNLIMQGQSASLASNNAGFHDYSSFYRAFKKNTGHSPTSKISGELLL
ncbi:AraC family transcriptional regulator [Clostridium estertheticum]|uniref:helix-turn-helix domain-containing protein n=1 Tax=Clostridium estertheticum TaxID=238834 RepID=UPI001C0CEB67|nr:AraC family transcriptional regulator [Clostridium estertheticum]MBU3179049.1 AraC family transcriptional regulator [Clostridium estertheticum]